ncbi:flavin-containing monooxygenase [Nocardia cyriacigeorgica]|uniref:flavin-containing monooxygenase n=1 Tax=Nocardia cyriacigeorgica TaxID=135487 RepID=UPI001893FD31|nr:NAD(P)/FAD-dependent oxidoreductase [Nocardia cyriacigeorgica]MBF6455664.1 NAD(P)-binding domain-containing protein [Nocardia cyriacigeorgica]MBF6478825.1 NAD(P)-binding domain-containing protein [Nocardia cyriacigeorgica]MBF6553594.1 NAD(P)-binding domain-containing protein [Nocardia cyriacigeorgica]
MTTQHIETLIIGAGQAGLATGSALRRRHRPLLIVDRNDRIGDNWRRHYDSLRLYSPAKYDGLPGLPFPSANPWSYPGKDDVADYLERYALHWDLPVRMRTGVDRLTARPGGGFVARLGGDTITCDNVVVATGTFGRTPYIPDFAAELDPAITQLHSSRYRRPGQLAPGPVLVVGASHSGTDIAYEVAGTHRTILCGRDCGQIPVRWDRPAIRFALPVLVFLWRHVLTRRTPIGRKVMREVRLHGGPMLRVKRADLAERGVRRNTARMSGVRDGLPELDDGTVVDVRNVVWATGFRQVFDWIDLPVIGEDGWPKEYRGVVDDMPGLYFCGLSFQYAFSSMVFPGVGRDAEYVARRIDARVREQTAVRAAA